MRGLPSPVIDYWHEFTLQTRSPAYLQVDKRGHLRGWGGNLPLYGIVGLRRGLPIGELVCVLEGLLPLKGRSSCLPCVTMASGRFADIHLFSEERADWVLFLDATAQEVQYRVLQQKANELGLLQEQHAKQRQPISSHRLESMPDAFLTDLLAAVNLLVLETLLDGSYRTVGRLPDWFQRFFPGLSAQPTTLQPDQLFPFLKNFLIDAEILWTQQSAGQVKSGPWIEVDQAGNEYPFEASAIRLGERKLLLVGSPQTEYQEKQAIMQRAREHRLDHYRSQKDAQKKDLLVHCIVHDLAGPLTAISAYFSLLHFECLTPTGHGYVQQGLQQATKLHFMIRQILDIFSAEMGALDAFITDHDRAPDVARCAAEMVEALQPACTRKHVTLQLELPLDPQVDWKVVGDQSHLERIIFNLVDNALRHSPAGSTVTVGIHGDGEAVVVTVDDQGSGVEPQHVGTLFEKFAQGRERAGKAGLGLYYCRMTVERWGGGIGYSPRPEGGSRFWFRLPRPALP